MAQVLAIDTRAAIRSSHRIVRKQVSVSYALKCSVNAMFFDLERGVRSIHAHYRSALTEAQVEDIIRETHREDVARVLHLGELRRAA